MIAMFSALWAMLTRFISAADHTAAALEDLAITANLHSTNLRLKTETELNHELEELRAQLALPAPAKSE